MNEQLTVKNFGPIKDATVDFKRVTVFIGPTGGGKSTLAKLAAIWRQIEFIISNPSITSSFFSNYGIDNFIQERSCISWTDIDGFSSLNASFQIENENKKNKAIDRATSQLQADDSKMNNFISFAQKFVEEATKIENIQRIENTSNLSRNIIDIIDIIIKPLFEILNITKPTYVPSERIFVASLEYSWAGLMRNDTRLSKVLLDFANQFSLSRKDVLELYIPFLSVRYLHIDGKDRIKIPEREESLILLETASGIQSVTPMLVLLEHLSRQKEQTQSFIIEEPELNLYPIAQQGLMNWLVEKCTKGENDLTITTHSPYILASCNLLIEAYKIWQERPELEAEIEKIVPRASWINPEEFAAYYVADGTVRSIQDERTDLVGGNELDAVSGQISDAFRSLLRLKKQPANA